MNSKGKKMRIYIPREPADGHVESWPSQTHGMVCFTRPSNKAILIVNEAYILNERKLICS